MSSPSPVSSSAPASAHAAAVRALVTTLVPPSAAKLATRAALERAAQVAESATPEATRDAIRDAARVAAAEHVAVPSRGGMFSRSRDCAGTARLLAARAAGTLGPATANDLDRHLATCQGCREMSARFAKADAAFDTAWDEPPAEPAPLVENEWSVALITEEPAPAPEPEAWVPPATDVAPATPGTAATAAPATWNVLDEGSPDAEKAAAGASWTVPALATVADPPAEKKDAAPDTWETGRAAPVALAHVDLHEAPGFKQPRDRTVLHRIAAVGLVALLLGGLVVSGVFDKDDSGQNGLPLAISPAGKSPDETAAAVRRVARQARARRTAARQRAARRRAAAATRRRRAAARRRAAQATAARGTGPVRTSAPVTAVAPPAQRSSGPARAQPQQSAPKLQEASPPASTSAPSFQPTTSNPSGAQSSGETGRTPTP